MKFKRIFCAVLAVSVLTFGSLSRPARAVVGVGTLALSATAAAALTAIWYATCFNIDAEPNDYGMSLDYALYDPAMQVSYGNLLNKWQASGESGRASLSALLADINDGISETLDGAISVTKDAYDTLVEFTQYVIDYYGFVDDGGEYVTLTSTDFIGTIATWTNDVGSVTYGTRVQCPVDESVLLGFINGYNILVVSAETYMTIYPSNTPTLRPGVGLVASLDLNYDAQDIVLLPFFNLAENAQTHCTYGIGIDNTNNGRWAFMLERDDNVGYIVTSGLGTNWSNLIDGADLGNFVLSQACYDTLWSGVPDITLTADKELIITDQGIPYISGAITGEGVYADFAVADVAVTPPGPGPDPEPDPELPPGVLPAEGLAEVFPFCIPFDIYAFLSAFSAERAAPQWDVPLDLGVLGYYEIDIDFSEFETLATVVRTVELVGFCVLLAVGTKKLLGW